MIITITGKPCSGKSPACDHFCKTHNFDYVGAGNFFRSIAQKKGYSTVTNFQKPEQTKEVDEAIDSALTEIGIVRRNEDVIIDGRTAWHFIPHSFKVYVDVDWVSAGKRLLEEKRETEPAKDLDEAINMLQSRHNNEIARYKALYNIDCLNMNNYDLVLNSTGKTTEQLSNEIYKAYQKFLKNKANK